MKASAIANSNIALAKYWGKRDENLMLPQNSSLSMTTDSMQTHTTVEFSDDYDNDSLIINSQLQKPGQPEFDDYIGKFLTSLRQKYKISTSIKIQTKNNFPTAAGLASSASGFAALSAAINSALELNLTDKELSIMARSGSGSATRSIHGGFVIWHKGEKQDGSDSYAEQLFTEDHWPEFRMIACVVDQSAKKVKSRAGMQQTVNTSPYYAQWLEEVEQDLKVIREGIKKRNIEQVGQTAEANAIKMHATAMTTKPSIFYWSSGTIEVIHRIQELREEGINAYFTIDGGPQVKVICLSKDLRFVKEKLTELGVIKGFYTAKPGSKYKISNSHLF